MVDCFPMNKKSECTIRATLGFPQNDQGVDPAKIGQSLKAQKVKCLNKNVIIIKNIVMAQISVLLHS